MGENWRTVFTGLDISFAAIFYYCAIKLAVNDKWAILYALTGLLWSMIAIPDIKELALELRKRRMT